MTARLRSPGVLGVLVAAIALALWLPGLGEYGLWAEAELPIFDRTRAELGAAVSGLVRSPWLPDLVRTRSHVLFGGGFGLRLPHALAAALLAGIAAGWTRARGSSILISLFAGLVALSFPALALSARTVLGNPIGELCSVLAILLGVVALRSSSAGRGAAFATAAIGCLALSISASGLVVGGCIPLLAVAVADHDRPKRIVRIAIAIAILGAIGAAVWLSLHQADGYIPLLGAAKDLELVDKPNTRGYADVLAEFGHQTFPWAGLAMLGVVSSRGRFAVLWVVGALGIAGGWSLVYGPVPLPVAVPTAMACAAGVEAILDVERPVVHRRLAVLFVIGGALAMRKDAELKPQKVAVPHHHFESSSAYPDEPLEAGERLRRLAALVMLAVLGAAIVARRREDGPGAFLEHGLGRIRAEARDPIAIALLAASATYGAVLHAHVLIPRSGELLSTKTLFDRHRRFAEAGELPEAVAVHRARDDSLAVYGPDSMPVLASRREISTYLAAEEPRVALVRDIDLPAAHLTHRQQGWPLYVLDDSHFHLRLLANRLPQGVVDRNPIPTVVFDEAPQLANETLVKYEEYVELIGWEVDGPLRRGRKHTLKLAFKVMRPLPGGSKIYARFQKGKLARINWEPHHFVEKVYPPNMWREGDFVLHSFTFEVPWLETVSGDYKFVVALRRGEKRNFDISVPEGDEGEFGVKITDKRRNFATIGYVEVW